MIKISLKYSGATYVIELDEGEIKCENTQLKDAIEKLVMSSPVKGYTPDKDTYYANIIVGLFKGEIIYRDEVPYDENLIY